MRVEDGIGVKVKVGRRKKLGLGGMKKKGAPADTLWGEKWREEGVKKKIWAFEGGLKIVRSFQ